MRGVLVSGFATMIILILILLVEPCFAFQTGDALEEQVRNARDLPPAVETVFPAPQSENPSPSSIEVPKDVPVVPPKVIVSAPAMDQMKPYGYVYLFLGLSVLVNGIFLYFAITKPTLFISRVEPAHLPGNPQASGIQSQVDLTQDKALEEELKQYDFEIIQRGRLDIG